jgi:hypothetical protein
MSVTVQQQPHQPTFQVVANIDDIEPFRVDPILRYFRDRNSSELRVALISVFSVLGLAIVGAALSNNGFWAVPMERSTFQDFMGSFSARESGTLGTAHVPLLRDYASMVAAVTACCAPWFIYALFNALSEMHSTLARNGCLEISSSMTVAAINDEVADLNAKFKRYGESGRSMMVLLLLAVGLAYVAGQGARDAFGYLVPPEDSRLDDTIAKLFEGWWARPFLPGYFVWVAIGSFALYMVYVEAIVGLSYTAFLRRHRDKYRFRANSYNIDGYYGWENLRKAYTFMIAGVATSALSMYPIYVYLTSAISQPATIALLIGYIGVVLYVSLASALMLTAHVKGAKIDAMQSLAAELEMLRTANTVESLLRRQLLSDELRYYREIPAFPVASRWTVVAGLVTVIGVLASLAQIFDVFGRTG